VSWRFFPYLDQGLHNGFSIGEDDQTPLRLFICHNAIRSLRSKEYRARELGIPLYFLLLASWGIVQRRYSSSLREEVEASDTVFGLWHLGRLEDSESSPELDMPSLAVPTINILPVRIEYGKGSDENIVLGAGKRLQLQLKKRSFVIQQSRWIDVAKWIAEVQETSHPRLCNVFVNILRTPDEIGRPLNKSSLGDVPTSQVAVKAVKFPYSPSSRMNVEPSRLRPRYEITEVIQPDLLIDIFFNLLNDTVGISFECEGSVLNDDLAKKLAAEWAELVDSALQ